MSLPQRASSQAARDADAHAGPGEAQLPLETLIDAERSAENAVHGLRHRLVQAFADLPPVEGAGDFPPLDGSAASLDGQATAMVCLVPFLLALGWAGETRHLREALPHLEPVTDVESLRSVLARLNIATRERRLTLGDVVHDHLPCLFVPDEGGLWVVMERDADGRLLVFDGGIADFHFIEDQAWDGTAYFADGLEESESTPAPANWLGTTVRHFRKTIVSLFAASLAINLFAMVVPVFVMTVYDQVVPARSTMTLAYLVSGIGIVLVADFALRRLRTHALSFFGARLESLVSIAAVERLLYMPVSMTEGAPIGAQIARLRRFDVVRDLFVGPLATAAFDLPFLVIFLTAMAVIGGPLVWVPLGLIAVLAVVGVLSAPVSRRLQAEAGLARGVNRKTLTELVTAHRSIRDVGIGARWVDRYRETAGDTVIKEYRAQQFVSMIQTLTQSFTMLAGILTIGLGAKMALTGDLSVGALVAIVAMVWRITAPIQAGFVGIGKIGQVTDGVRQINALMRLPLERAPGRLPSLFRALKGSISFVRVVFRYGPQTEPALAGVSFNVEAGSLVAITGPSGAGKSTLIKLLVGLYQPQGGATLADGLDTRQINAGELRHMIGYAPQESHLFYGTVMQNIRLAHPEASDEAVFKALIECGLEEAVAALPNGANTRLTGAVIESLPASVRQQLLLARAFVKDVSLYVLDEPGRDLDPQADRALMEKLASLKGRATIVMVSHRPSHIRLADQVVVLKDGQIDKAGSPEQILGPH